MASLELFYKKFMESASKAYKRALAPELNQMGLQYEDLMISERPAYKEALSLQDHEIQQGRLRRLKRASDLSFKGKRLTDYAPHMKLDPFKVEFYPDVVKIQNRDEEYELLELHKK